MDTPLFFVGLTVRKKAALNKVLDAMSWHPSYRGQDGTRIPLDPLGELRWVARMLFDWLNVDPCVPAWAPSSLHTGTWALQISASRFS